MSSYIFKQRARTTEWSAKSTKEIKEKIPITSKLQSNYTLPWFLDIR